MTLSSAASTLSPLRIFGKTKDFCMRIRILKLKGIHICSIFLACALFVKSPAYAGNGGGGAAYLSIGEKDVIDRALLTAPDTLAALEMLRAKESGIEAAKSTFDTYIKGDIGYTRNEFERSSTWFGTREDTMTWGLGVSKKLPSGTSASLTWTNRRDQLFGVPEIAGRNIFPREPIYESTVSLSVNQPILKNAGGKIDRAAVEEAKRVFEAADLNTKYRVTAIAKDALIAYWRWVISFKYLEAYEKGILDAIHFLNVVTEKVSLGTAENTDLLAAKANLINKRNGLLAAERVNREMERAVRVVLGIGTEPKIMPRERSVKFDEDYYKDQAAAISHALASRWDYLAKKREIEGLNIKTVALKNARWPELDVSATFAVNGLKSDYKNSVGGMDNPYFGVGASLSIPLEGRAASAALKGAEHAKAVAIIELKKMEMEIANSIASLIKVVELNRKIVENAQEVLALQKEKLEEELQKYKLGRSSADIVIRYQDDLLYASSTALDAWANYKESVINLKFAQNLLVKE